MAARAVARVTAISLDANGVLVDMSVSAWETTAGAVTYGVMGHNISVTANISQFNDDLVAAAVAVVTHFTLNPRDLFFQPFARG